MIKKVTSVRRWVMVGVVIGALSLAVAGGTVLAQTADEDGPPGPPQADEKESPHREFAGRVAEILGLEEDEVEDAFAQARREMRDARAERRLDALVERGRLSREEADEYLEWFQSRPDAGLHPKMLRGLRPHGMFRGAPHGDWGAKHDLDRGG